MIWKCISYKTVKSKLVQTLLWHLCEWRHVGESNPVYLVLFIWGLFLCITFLLVIIKLQLNCAVCPHSFKLTFLMRGQFCQERIWSSSSSSSSSTRQSAFFGKETKIYFKTKTHGKRNMCEAQNLTCLLGDIFHSSPGSSDITSPYKLLWQAASLSRTCLVLELDWKNMEKFIVSDESRSHQCHSILLSIAHTWKLKHSCSASQTTK